MYTEQLIDHFQNPRNYGSMENPSVVVELSKPDLGDSITLFLKIEKDIITDIKYEAFGCPAAIATSSALSEMVVGKSLEEAMAITKEQVADAIGGLPENKMICSTVCVEAFEMAIKDYQDKKQHTENQ